jgi:hypothetical protein
VTTLLEYCLHVELCKACVLTNYTGDLKNENGLTTCSHSLHKETILKSEIVGDMSKKSYEFSNPWWCTSSLINISSFAKFASTGGGRVTALMSSSIGTLLVHPELPLSVLVSKALDEAQFVVFRRWQQLLVQECEFGWVVVIRWQKCYMD